MILSQIQCHNINKLALVSKKEEITYGQLTERIKYFAAEFSSKSSTEIFLLNSENSIENLIALFAANYIGKIGIICSKYLSKDQIENLKGKKGYELINKLEYCQSNPRIKATKNEANNTFLGVLSSGSTEEPKIIFKDYQSWVSAFEHQSQIFNINKNSNVFCLDSLAYSANLNTALHILWQGGTLILGKLNEKNSWQSLFDRYLVNSIFLVPSHLRILEKEFSGNVDQVKSITTAGEKLQANFAKELIAKFPEANITEYYGTAELGHITYHQNLEIVTNPESLGKSFPGVKISFKEQMIFVDSPYVSPGYREVPTSYDFGQIIKGNLIVFGRAGRMFNKRGLNIFAEEIENKVKIIPDIIQAVLINKKERLVLAFTSNKPNFAPILKKFVHDNLPEIKRPHNYEQLQDIPLKSTGKINYKALQKIIEEDELLIV